MVSEIERNFEKLNEKIIGYFQNNDESLSAAKELFASFIRSNRQLESVSSIEQLLGLLKRKGFYKAGEFNVFRIFRKIIDDDDYLALVTRHQQLVNSYRDTQEPPVNIYGN